MVKAYNTSHHLVKTHTHANLDRSIVSGWTAKKYLDMFKEISPEMLNMRTKVRFEVRVRITAHETFEISSSGRSPLQDAVDAIIEVWKCSEWIHLSSRRIQQSMERVFNYVKSPDIPPMFRCFNIRESKRLQDPARNFAAITLMNFGYTSKRSNRMFCKTYDWDGNSPRPINWYLYNVWVHYFNTHNRNAPLRKGPTLISPTRDRSEEMRCCFISSEWYQLISNEVEDSIYIDLGGNYSIELNIDNMDPGLDGFMDRARQGIPMPVSEGGYARDCGDDNIPNDPNWGHRSGYDEQIDEITDRVKFFKRTNGKYYALYRTEGGGAAAFGRRPVDVARRIIERMEITDPQADRFREWRENLVLRKKLVLESESEIGHFGIPVVEEKQLSEENEEGEERQQTEDEVTIPMVEVQTAKLTKQKNMIMKTVKFYRQGGTYRIRNTAGHVVAGGNTKAEIVDKILRNIPEWRIKLSLKKKR